MHELSLCLRLVRQVDRVAAEHGATEVRKIVVRIGPLSGVEPELLERAFPLAAAGTLAAGAELALERLPVRVRCPVCGTEREATPADLRCGACGEWRTELVSGRELLLASVEIAMEERDLV